MNKLKLYKPSELVSDAWVSLGCLKGSEFEIEGERYLIRTDVDALAQDAFRAVGAALPKRVEKL